MRSRLLAAAVVTALIGPAMAADSQRGVTDNEIVIGTYTDLSGVTAMWGVNNTNAWRMVFDDVNSEGGINSRKIKYIVEDNQYQIPRSVQAANKLINRDGVFMMVANGGTPMNNATMPDQLAKGVPNIFPLTSARSMYEPLHHLKFGFAASYYDQMRSGVKLFVEQHHNKAICAMSQDTDFGRDVMAGAKDQLADELPALARRVRRFTELPIAIGFGISLPGHVSLLGGLADAAVVGSALVEEIERAESVDAAAASLAARVKLLKGAAVTGMSRREPQA